MKFKKILLCAVTAALIFASLPALRLNVSANGATERTAALNLTASEFDSDQSNSAEGWSWVAATHTLTLNSVKFNTGSNSAIIVDGTKNVTLTLQGSSTITSAAATITRNNTAAADAGLFINGTGELTVTNTGDRWSTFDQSNLTLNSGTLNAVGGAIMTVNSIYVNGGTLNVDTSKVSESGMNDGLYGCASIEITGGTVNINAARIAIYNTGTARPTPRIGVRITGGNITLCSPLCDIYAGQDNPKDIYIKNTQIDFTNSPRGIFSSHGNTTIESGKFKTAQLKNIFLLGSENQAATVNIAAADYTAVAQQQKRIPLDTSLYTEESMKAVTDANAAVLTGKNILEQDKVEGYAANLKTAIDNLQYNPADYSAVNAAIGRIPADLSQYTEDSVNALKSAESAVVRDKIITEQADVDGYAEAINAAISNLQYNPADYSAVDAAIARIPADLSQYTEDSVNALKGAENAVVRGKNITEQADVDGYAKAIDAAISKLQYKPADYSAVDAAIARIPADLSQYTKDSVNALKGAENAVVRGKNITKQADVDGYAKAIDAAIKGLAKKADTTSTVTSPQTGEMSSPYILIILLFVSCGTAAVFGFTKKREKV